MYRSYGFPNFNATRDNSNVILFTEPIILKQEIRI